MLRLISLILLLCLSLNSFASNAVPLFEGEPAPFKGVLLKETTLIELYRDSEEREIIDKQNIKLKDLAAAKDSRIEFYKQEVKETEKLLRREKRSSFWKSIGYFTLGCVLTGLAAKVAIESSRR